MPELQTRRTRTGRQPATFAPSPTSPAPVEEIDLTRSLAALRTVPDVVSLTEVHRYTGMAPERLRTWGRRFGFPQAVDGANGKRGISAEDLPAIIAAGQLIADGLPVADAIAEVRDGVPAVELQTFEASFGALSVPVVLLGGPHPLQVVWANAAARGAAGAPPLPPDPTARTYRAFQRMLIDFDGTAAVVNHQDWHDPAQRMESLAWTVGSPAARPPLVLVMGLGNDLGDVPDRPQQSRDHVDAAWATAVGRARRELQRAVPASAASFSLGALVDGSPAEDGFFMLVHDTELRPASSCRGARRAPRVNRSAWRELQHAWDDLEPVWLGRALREELGTSGEACLALPLSARGVLKGFAVLEFAGVTEVSPDALELLMGWATAAAASQSREIAAAERARQRQLPMR